jgi:hypothetical protein
LIRDQDFCSAAGEWVSAFLAAMFIFGFGAGILIWQLTDQVVPEKRGLAFGLFFTPGTSVIAIPGLGRDCGTLRPGAVLDHVAACLISIHCLVLIPLARDRPETATVWIFCGYTTLI